MSIKQFPAHTLLWVGDILPLEQQPDWYPQHDVTRPVVVRRAQHPTQIPVGIRGEGRSQRLAAWVEPRQITRVMLPEEVAQTQNWHGQYKRHPLPQFLALEQVDTIFKQYNLPWGIGGSIGFELATGFVTANENSDLDLVVALYQPIDEQYLKQLWQALGDVGVAMDVQIETPNGAFALREWLQRGSQPVMMKTPQAPVLTTNPWA